MNKHITFDKPSIIHFNKIGNSSIGFISIAENSILPFEIKRVYWTYFTPNDVMRGHHAHKNLQQILFAVNGSIEVELITKEKEVLKFNLHNPSEGLYIPPMCWRTLQFSHSAVLLCLASEEYTEADYIRSKEEFLNLIV
ncbi:MAG: FdtA/QdtA family cupin domain-containing protein [Cyclobacteriaceae bacterium]|nr:FdtA/QdtA family cupin domain-containing protein [Flammeovirgaceae bacterium]MCZ8021387.1 FdtA/QdtA family cupin domain-containing protein [Cytophagales bacterium]MCZ8327967.1 FdtA/QdtA family cupin domain-containing protein [Cyclobacteriaceae bacterium]